MVRTERLELTESDPAQLQPNKHANESMRKWVSLFPECSHLDAAGAHHTTWPAIFHVFRLSHGEKVI